MKDDVMAIWPLSAKAFSLTLCRKAGAVLIGAGLVSAGLGLAGFSACAQQAVGTATGLPVPRYVSLKSDHVNLREGPSKDHATKWIYQRAGLPVEITAEYEIWRRIRDLEGSEGWVLHSLLSGKRTVLVSPWKKDVPPLPLRVEPGDDANSPQNLHPASSRGSKNATEPGAASRAMAMTAICRRPICGGFIRARRWSRSCSLPTKHARRQALSFGVAPASTSKPIHPPPAFGVLGFSLLFSGVSLLSCLGDRLVPVRFKQLSA